MRYAILTAFLAGCAATGGDIVYKQNVDPYYSLPEANAYASAGAPVVILGAPRDGASPKEVAASMRLPAYFSQRQLSAITEAGRGNRLVLVFEPSISASSEQVCAGEAKGGQAGATLRVFGVYCTGTRRAISEGVLEFSGSPVPGDPAFSAGLENLAQVLFPPVSPGDQDAGRCRLPFC